MPLLLPTLRIELSKIMDQSSPLFEGFPETNIEVANRWSTAIKIYTTSIIPYSANSELAKEAFKLAILPISAQSQNGAALFQTAFTSFASQLAIGMAPAFTGIPPIVPINLLPVNPIGFGGGSSSSCVSLMSTIIDTWFRTGSAVLNAPSAAVTIWN